MIRRKEIILYFVIYLIVGYAFFRHATLGQYQNNLMIVLDAIVVMFLMNHGSKVLNNKTQFNGLILLLFFIPYLSGISKLLYTGGHFLSMPTVITSIGFGFYYIFCVRHCSEERIIKSLVVVGLVIFAIQVFQQLYPQYAVFGIYDEERSMRNNYELVEERNGLMRFSLGGVNITLMCMYYYWGKILERRSVKNLLIFALFILSMYLFLTRQIIFSSILAFLSTLLFQGKTKNHWKVLFFVVALLLGIALNFESLFGELAESAESEFNTDNIRYASIMYFGEKIFTNPVTILFGNGLGAMNMDLKDIGLDPTDIGFVGQAFYYGLLWIAVWLYTIYLILFKYGSKLPLYIKLFVLGTSIHSLGMFPYRSASEAAIWAAMLYISSLYIKKDSNFEVKR